MDRDKLCRNIYVIERICVLFQMQWKAIGANVSDLHFFKTSLWLFLVKYTRRGESSGVEVRRLSQIIQARNDGYLDCVLTVEQDKNRHILEAGQQDLLTDQMRMERK